MADFRLTFEQNNVTLPSALELTMKSPLSPRKAANVPDSVRQRLHSYTLAAGAAGVTMLALAPLGEAEIIYTSADQNIVPYGYYALDLNGDGTTDFYFIDFSKNSTGFSFGYLAVQPALAGNAVARKVRSDKTVPLFLGRAGPFAAALQSGHRVGPKQNWSTRYPLMEYGYKENTFPYRSRCFGPWKNKQNRYLGLKFMISGEVHYGWARLSETCSQQDKAIQSALLTGYAYETIPNQAIKAGQEQGTDDGIEQLDSPNASEMAPATLGHLARGAQALSFRRRKEAMVEQQNTH